MRRTKEYFDKVFGSKFEDHPDEVVGFSKYTGFSEGRMETNNRFRMNKRRTFKWQSPNTGKLYSFRQSGGSNESQWVAVRSEKDFAMFNHADKFETRRTSPQGE